MSDLVKSIIEKNYTEAERLFHERIEAIAESKMIEMKKMIAAKDYMLNEISRGKVQAYLDKREKLLRGKPVDIRKGSFDSTVKTLQNAVFKLHGGARVMATPNDKPKKAGKKT